MATRELFIGPDIAASDGEALDAYSATVSGVAERLLPAVASLRVGRSGGRRPEGSGSAVAVSADGVLITSAHVVDGANRGSARFADGGEYDTAVVGGGLGLAVPINSVTVRILNALLRQGRVLRGYIGIAGGTLPLPPAAAERLERKGAIGIMEVVSGSPAEQAGLRAGDLIVA